MARMPADSRSRSDDPAPTDELRAALADRTIELQALERRLRREQAARHEAEQIGEAATRRMYLTIQELERANLALKVAQEQAEESARAKAVFLANMSHELRTPMNGVLGMLDIPLGTELATDQRELAQVAQGSAASLLEVLTALLDYASVDAGRLELQPSDFRLRPLVEEVAEVAMRADRRKRVPVVSLVHHSVPDEVCGDPMRLRQILLNLVGNAVKFTDRGEIKVRVRLDGDAAPGGPLVRFEVEDHGPGIAPDDQRRLFQPFTQLDMSHTRRHGGTGLGLAIARRLVELFRGEIGVRSTLGAGSTFWFTARLAWPAGRGA
jgi:signal transduction histidine kinase